MSRLSWDFKIVVNFHAVMNHRDSCISDLLLTFPTWLIKLNIITLPFTGWTTDNRIGLLGFIDSLVEAGNYKIKSEVVREGLRQLIDDGENSGDLLEWNVDSFLDRINTKN